MSLFSEHFYHKTIHLYSAVFGTLFSEMYIVRDNGKTIKIPLSYAGQQKENVRNEENPDPNAARYKMRLPRLSYLLTNMQRDETRLTNKMYRLQDITTDRTTVSSINTQLNRIPYTFSYQLNAKTKHLDDMLQIIEQIAAWFNPNIQVVVDDNPDINENTAVNIIMRDFSLNDQFEGAFEEGRSIEATWNFDLEGYLYMPTNNSGIIKTININYRDLINPDTILETDVITS